MVADAAPSFVFVPSLAEGSGAIVLEGDEAHYLTRVARVRPGDHVSATDGRGALATLEILETRPVLRARRGELERRKRTRSLEVWCGAPEGDRADWLIEKLGEVGAAVFQPVESERAVWKRARNRTERWNRLAVAALRQSRSTHLLEIREPRPLDELLADTPAAGSRWVGREGGGPPGVPAPAGSSIAAIGPSSGFSAAESKRLEELGFVPVSLAASRLRTETAALAFAAAWAAGESMSS